MFVNISHFLHLKNNLAKLAMQDPSGKGFHCCITWAQQGGGEEAGKVVIKNMDYRYLDTSGHALSNMYKAKGPESVHK